MSILNLAHNILKAADPSAKTAAAFALGGACQHVFDIAPLEANLNDNPARPDAPKLVAPHSVKKRGLGSEAGRKALLHAVAHIEFNAIDLAADMIARFTFDARIAPDKRVDFIRDWAKVCTEEAKHFSLVRTRLQSLGADYGDYEAHGGLWAAALNTRHDLAARLAIAPMVLEARGLDVTPNMIGKLTQAGDHDSAAILQIIYNEEIGHVSIGTHWFHYVAAQHALSARAYFRQLVREFFRGTIKPPFNIPARDLAGLQKEFYMGLEN